MANDKLYAWENKTTSLNNITIEENINENLNANINLSANILENPNPILKSNSLLPGMGADEIAEEKKGEIAENMPRNISIFSGKEDFIRNARYTFIGKNNEKKHGTRTKPSKTYMLPLLDSLKELDKELEEKVNADDGDKIEALFKKVCLSCEKYLDNHNPWSHEGKARKQMVQDIYDQAKIESLRFSARIEQIRAKTEVIDGDATWISILKDVRTEKITDGVDGYQVSIGGGNTSKVYIIEKNGQKRFFKETEKIPPSTLDDNLVIESNRLRDELGKYNADNSHSQEEKKQFEKNQRNKWELLLIVKNALMEKYNSTSKFRKYMLDAKPDTFFVFVKNNIQDDTDQEKFKDAWIKASEISNDLDNAIKNNNKPEDIAKLKEQKDESACYYVFNTLKDMCKKTLNSAIATTDALIDPGSELSKRNVASARMSKLLKLNTKEHNLIAGSNLADVTINGKTMQGIIMDGVPGMSTADLEKQEKAANREVKYSPTAFRELLNLQISDIIMGQIDRNRGNYLGDYTQKDNSVTEITHITGIDNDMCGGLLKYNYILYKGYMGLNRLRNIADTNNNSWLPAFDKNLAEQIKLLTPEIIHHNFCDILNKEEREAMIDRIKGVQKVIRKLEKTDTKGLEKNPRYKTKLISSDEDWKTRLDEYRAHINASIKVDEENARLLEERLNEQFQRDIEAYNLSDKKKEQLKKYYKSLVDNKKTKTEQDLKNISYLRAQFL